MWRVVLALLLLAAPAPASDENPTYFIGIIEFDADDDPPFSDACLTYDTTLGYFDWEMCTAGLYAPVWDLNNIQSEVIGSYRIQLDNNNDQSATFEVYNGDDALGVLVFSIDESGNVLTASTGNITANGNFNGTGSTDFLLDTADASDDKAIRLCASGACGATRGAHVTAYGNEVAGFGLYGDLLLRAGDGDAGSNKGDVWMLVDSTSNQANARWSATEKLEFSGDVPTVSSCGSSPSIVGVSVAGAVTTGTGTPTACTLTFVENWTNAPHCSIMPRSATPGALYLSAVSTSAITFTWTVAAASTVFDYVCLGHF